MKVVAISDTHMSHEELGHLEGDLLVVAGDFCSIGNLTEFTRFNNWLGFIKKNFTYIPVIVMGNHDLYAEAAGEEDTQDVLYNAEVLHERLIEVDGKRIYGCPYMPQFYNWAFMRSEFALERQHYIKIPEGLDLLITHGPPYGILDKNMRGDWCGSHALYNRLSKMKSPPKNHVFGHIHAFATEDARFNDLREDKTHHFNKQPHYEFGCNFYNVSIMNEYYSPEYPAMEFHI